MSGVASAHRTLRTPCGPTSFSLEDPQSLSCVTERWKLGLIWRYSRRAMRGDWDPGLGVGSGRFGRLRANSAGREIGRNHLVDAKRRWRRLRRKLQRCNIYNSLP